MASSAAATDEERRLEALRAYGVGAPLAEPGLDRLTHLAADIFQVPVALISLVEAHRQDATMQAKPGLVAAPPTTPSSTA